MIEYILLIPFFIYLILLLLSDKINKWEERKLKEYFEKKRNYQE